MKKLLMVLLGMMLLGCANHKTLKQKERQYYDTIIQRYELLIKTMTNDYMECDRFFKNGTLDVNSYKECYKRVDEYGARETKRLDDELREFKEEKRHQELMDAIRRR